MRFATCLASIISMIFFHERPLEVRTRVAVIRKEDDVLEAFSFAVFLQQGALVLNAVGLSARLSSLTEPP